jgi:hypothetical protein
MNCLEYRRRTLADPRRSTIEQRRHAAQCTDCAAFGARMTDLDLDIEAAAYVRIPDGLTERVMLARPRPRHRRMVWLAAAAVVLASVALGIMVPAALEALDSPLPAEAVGATHPAVAAISLVVEREPVLLKEGRRGDAGVLEARLKHLGLALPGGSTAVRYIGRCELSGGDCDHLVLITPDGHASVILVPGEHTPGRVLISDRRMIALLSPAGSGAYIVVAESPRAVKRAQKLLVKG